MRVVCLGVCLLVACEARLGGPPEETPGDALPPDSTQIDPDTQPACKKRPIYLSFEGETLTDGAPSDAPSNIASWMTNGVTQATAPPYHAGVANRADEIQAITTAVTNRLAPFQITVTTQRPMTGEYMMIVFGGTPNAMGSNFGFVQELDCDDSTRNDVAWVADGFPIGAIPDTVLGSIGFSIGLTATLDPTDCMCAWDNSCVPAAGDCVLHDGIARDPDANQRCPGAPDIQNETQAVNAAFCN